MKLTIFDQVSYSEEVISEKIVKQLEKILIEEDGYWLYGEPYYSNEANSQPTFTILTKRIGLVFIKCFPFSKYDFETVNARTWNVNGKNKLSGILAFRTYLNVVQSKIQMPLLEFNSIPEAKVVYVFPNLSSIDGFEFDLLDNEEVVFGNNEVTLSESSVILSSNDYKLLVGIIQHNDILKKKNDSFAEETPTDLNGAINQNNSKISLFDSEQMRASLTITEDSERIRGLAGTGKTVLLAIKAARLHHKYPEKNIAVVFYTKSLYVQVKNLISKYYDIVAHDEPNWNKLKVLHSWGGATTGEGFYSYICNQNEIKPKIFRNTSLEEVCLELLSENLKESFDVVLIDEGQDFPLSFYKLVYKVLSGKKKVVVAYDELQSTNEIKIPQFDELFGTDKNGIANIVLKPENDYTLKVSYRNTLETLVTAFAFGFGFYGEQLTQIIDNSSTWEAFGFKSTGVFSEGNTIYIERPTANSPNNVSKYFDKEPVTFKHLSDENEFVDYISNEVNNLITKENVSPEEIMIIDINMNKTNSLNMIQSRLFDLGIKTIIPGIVDDSRKFIVENNVTLTTPRNAKGNEVSIVFVIGIEDIYKSNNLKYQRISRNFMFISMTRTKGWLYLVTMGRVKTKFETEYRQIKKNIPSIVFKYPSENKILELNRIDFLYNNPKAVRADETLYKLKTDLANNSDIIKQLIELDPQLKEKLKGLLED